ncbi:hypothetical protein [Chelativorans sp. YIM 93263]|uniref:hypothetical protein n=1 Tax=Chelativorans sp. YIM 93263 TaxID=2906648 RepID=UPI00237965EA|nr:hypothetical protein [Chelativorans sp. YIM 93263]
MPSFITKQQKVNPATVTGWGVDADPRNDPTYPYRDRAGDEERAMTWDRPSLQEPRVEVLRSIEHNRLPAVFGTSVPPRGLSGSIRRIAFGYSESDWRHWLMLLAADRINMVEGVLGDLLQGRIPNLPAEMGLRAEWKHNKTGLVRKAAVLAAASALALMLLSRRKRYRR